MPARHKDSGGGDDELKWLRPYTFHGLEVNWNGRGDEATADCPWCDSAKFYVNRVRGVWECKVCLEKGNQYGFLRTLHKASKDETAAHEALRESRRLLSVETLARWGVVRSKLDDSWLVPGHGPDGKLNQLYKYAPPAKGAKPVLLPTPAMECGLQLVGVPLFDPKKDKVALCEGAWDAMALWEVLRYTRLDADGSYSRTADEGASLLSGWNVLATPGAGQFRENWCALLKDKDVYLLPDNDHPRTNGDSVVEGAGYLGARRLVRLFSEAEEKPRSVHYLRWGKADGDTHDAALPSGYDVRDLLTDSSDEAPLGSRQRQLKKLMQMLHPIPQAWLGRERSKNVAKGSVELQPEKCEKWSVLVNNWKKAMKWVEGLDRALSVMLASCLSTKAIGDQLWVKVVGPPSCLHGDTPIHDPTDGTTLSVRERCRLGEKFNVWTWKGDHLGVAQALPPEEYPPAPMYRVGFSSGREVTVTEGHRFWTGDGYVSVRQLSDGLLRGVSFRLPSISGTDLSTRRPGVPRSSRTTEGSPGGCRACRRSCGGPPPRGSGSGPGVPPSPVDAPRRSRGGSGSDAPAASDRRSRRPSSRLSIEESSVHSGRSRTEDGCGRLLSEGTCGRCASPRPSDGRSLLRSVRTRTASPSCRSRYGSTCRSGSSLLPPSVRPSPSWTWLGGRHSTWQWSSLPGSSPGSPSCGLPSSDASPQDGSLLRPGADTCGASLMLLRGSCNTRRTCDRPDTGLRLAGDALETREQPRYFSLEADTGNWGTLSLSDVDEVVSVEYVGEQAYYDFSVPETQNYWACGVLNHNCGKSVLCEAVSVAKKYVAAKSTIRGFHSGFQMDKEGTIDSSLISQLVDKTLVTKDGDTLLQAPNLPQILAEARDIYDRTSRTHYRNRMGKDYEGINMTWLLCGTSSLRQLDSSELGERFLDCVIMEDMDEDLEDEITLRKAYSAERDLNFLANGEAASRENPEMTKAKQLTGGYVEYLRENAEQLLAATHFPEEYLRECTRLATFVAFMRARPSARQEEKADRELAIRLTSQLVRLAKCLAVVLNAKAVNEDVMRRTRKTAMDTARGRTFQIAKCLYQAGAEGLSSASVSVFTGQKEEKEKDLLRFLGQIKAVEPFMAAKRGLKGKAVWRLTERMTRLWEEVVVESELT